MGEGDNLALANNTLTIATEDNIHSYSLIQGNGENGYDQTFRNTNNIALADTQGFLIKKQAGRDRVRVQLEITDTKSNLRTNFLPMLNYPVPVNVTFDREIPFRDSTQGKFEIVDSELLAEYGDDSLRIQVTLIEVLAQ